MPLSKNAIKHPFPADVFADVIDANREYADTFTHQELTGTARKGLALVTCMDSRIEPLAMLGLEAGDVKIIRNAGARATDDVIRTLVLATFLLGVRRVLLVPHTDCKMASAEEADVHATIREQYGIDTRSIEIRTVSDQVAALTTDIMRLRANPLAPEGVVIGGAIYDVRTGRLNPLDI